MNKREEHLKAWKDYTEKMVLRRGDTKPIVHLSNFLEATQAAKDYYLHLSENFGDFKLITDDPEEDDLK